MAGSDREKGASTTQAGGNVSVLYLSLTTFIAHQHCPGARGADTPSSTLHVISSTFSTIDAMMEPSKSNEVLISFLTPPSNFTGRLPPVKHFVTLSPTWHTDHSDHRGTPLLAR